MQYSNDAAEIKLRKTDWHVRCIVFGNMTQDIQSLEGYDSTSSHGLVLQKSTKITINCNTESQYLNRNSLDWSTYLDSFSTFTNPT